MSDEWRFEGACPTQGHGRAANGAPFYFRARHGEWTLQIGEPGWPVDYVEWPSEPEDIAQGSDGSSGYMDFDTARALVVALLAAHFNEPLIPQIDVTPIGQTERTWAAGAAVALEKERGQ